MSETITPLRMQVTSGSAASRPVSLPARLAADTEDVLAPAASSPAAAPADPRLTGVSVVIPAYNEELVIGSVVLKACRIVNKVIVVDDGSVDRTAEVARYAGADVIRLEANQGKAMPSFSGWNAHGISGAPQPLPLMATASTRLMILPGWSGRSLTGRPIS